MLAAHKQSLNSSVASRASLLDDQTVKRDDMMARHKMEHAALRRRHDDEDAKDPTRRHRHEPEARAREHAELTSKQRNGNVIFSALSSGVVGLGSANYPFNAERSEGIHVDAGQRTAAKLRGQR